MPTIEIVSIESRKLGLNQADFNFAIDEQCELISHRGLFWEYLRTKAGTIVHIGNPDFKDNKDHGFFGGHLVDWDFEPESSSLSDKSQANDELMLQLRFKFLPNHAIEIARIIDIGVCESPQKQVMFLTDYQFGPTEAKMKDMKLADFWNTHDTNGLEWNTLYHLMD